MHKLLGALTPKDAALMVGLAIVYFAAAKLGLALAVQAPQISAVWPPTGIAIAAAFKWGFRALPAVFAGAFAANATADEPLWVAAGIATGNTLEAWVGAYIMASAAAHINGNRIREALALLGAAVVAPIISASFGVAFLVAGGVQPASQLVALWRVWWVGDALGALLLIPLLSTWAQTLAHHRKLLELAALLMVSALVCTAVFYQRAEPVFSEYIVFPFVIWAAMRLSVPATALVVILCDAIAIAATYFGFGPFADLGPERGLLHLQAFIAVAAITGLLLASLAEQRRRAEEALRQADRRKDEFLAMLAHELRNPLAAISNAAQLLAVDKADAANLVFARSVIARQTTHLARLLDDLLDVGRAINGRIHLTKDVMDLAVAVKSAVSTLETAGSTSRHDLTFDVESVYIAADRARIEQIVINLVSNALTYTPAGGHVHVAVRREGDYAVLIVTDNGIGLTADDRYHVFDLFYQTKRELNRKGGLGVGLTLVRRLVELHNGSVAAASDGAGKGAEFTVRLPVVEKQHAEVPIEQPQAEQRSEPRSVLVIEDNDDARISLTQLLALEGHTVHEAADGRSGLERAIHLQPDIALIDIGLPQMDGYEVARALRLQQSRSFLIALTGYGQSEDVRRAREAGFDAHLIKPADMEKVREAIAGAVPREPFYRADDDPSAAKTASANRS
jgi:signal transduction histidine kinase/FixJ family two-component response regulator